MDQQVTVTEKNPYQSSLEQFSKDFDEIKEDYISNSSIKDVNINTILQYIEIIIIMHIIQKNAERIQLQQQINYFLPIKFKAQVAKDGQQAKENGCAQTNISKKDKQPNNFIINSLSEIQIQNRLFNITEIYNVEMSPTSISIAYDSCSERNVILKKIFKNKLNELQNRQAILECQVSCQFNDFNIVKGFDHYENENEYSIIMELINDADYFHEKVENCHTPIKNELKLKSYMTDILHGLVYLHDQGYVHCDLKLANIFCEKIESEEDDGDVQIRRVRQNYIQRLQIIKQVKIGDFGLIQQIDKEKQTAYIEETCGTYGFKAPEVKKGAYITQKILNSYLHKADIWSLGVILYFMTVAYMPHHMKGYKYGQGPVPFRDFDWKKRSPDLKDFVQKMLSLEPNDRPSASEALQHPFLSICHLQNYQEMFI